LLVLERGQIDTYPGALPRIFTAENSLLKLHQGVENGTLLP
jgi:hypothetical protein